MEAKGSDYFNYRNYVVFENSAQMIINILNGKTQMNDVYLVIDWDYTKFIEFAREKYEEEKTWDKKDVTKYGIEKVVKDLERELVSAYKSGCKDEMEKSGEYQLCNYLLEGLKSIKDGSIDKI